MGVKNVKTYRRNKKSTNRGLAVVESVVGGKPDSTPMEFEHRKEGGKWKSVK